MKGKLYIDGFDAYTVYGVYITEGGYNELVAMPALKAVETNDWQEEDGVEADLLSPVLNTKDVQIKFAITESYGRYFSLIEMLSDGSYHTFDVSYIGRVYKLRLVSVQVSERVGDFALMTLKFADDYPLEGYTYKSPERTIAYDDSYTLDGLSFSEYGVRLLQGTLSEITKTPDVKTNMLRNIKTLSGAIYDPKTVIYKSKEVKLYCLMTAPTLSILWKNWDALLYDLTKPDERTLWVSALEQDFYLYYKSCQVSNFFVEGKIWLQFTLTVVFTHDFRIADDDTVLASEDGIIVFTQDGQYAIEMLADRYNFVTCRFVTNRQTLRLSQDGTFRFNN